MVFENLWKDPFTPRGLGHQSGKLNRFIPKDKTEFVESTFALHCDLLHAWSDTVWPEDGSIEKEKKYNQEARSCN